MRAVPFGRAGSERRRLRRRAPPRCSAPRPGGLATAAAFPPLHPLYSRQVMKGDLSMNDRERIDQLVKGEAAILKIVLEIRGRLERAEATIKDLYQRLGDVESALLDLDESSWARDILPRVEGNHREGGGEVAGS
jgi:hypothetical protein